MKPSLLGLGQGGKEIADSVEGLDVGDRIGARSSADRGLVHQNDVVDEIVAFEFAPVWGRRRLPVGLLLGGGQGLKQHVMQQRGFARSGHARDGDQHSQGHGEVDIFEIVRPRAGDLDLPRARLASRRGKLDAEFAGEVASGQGTGRLQYFVVASDRDHLAAALSRAGAEIENAIRGAHDIGIVLDHQDGVSQVAQVVQNLDQAMSVAAVQSDGRLVQHVQRPYQPRAQRSRQLDALGLAARKESKPAGPGSGIPALHQSGTAGARGFPPAACRRSPTPDRSA